MKSLPLSPAGFIVSSRLIVVFAAVIFLTALNLQAAAPSTTLRIQNTGADIEGLQTFQLEWDAVSNATYRVQRSGSLAPGVLWVTMDIVTPVGGTGQREIKGRSIPENSVEFYRLLLPQSEISAVEPAVLAPGVAVDLYIVGQCFSSNDVLRINGEPQTNTVFHSSALLSRPAFTPATPGTYVFELVIAGQVVSSFNVTCADALANPELVLQEPPTMPPAAPMRAVGRITFKAKEGATLARGLTGGGGIRENDNVVFEVQEGKKGLNAVNVKLACWSGEVQQQVVDLAVEGRGLDFVWARTYHSRLGRFDTSANGWTFSYDVRCAQNSSGGMDVYDGTGRKDTFKAQTNGVYTCPEFFREGTLTGSVFRLTFADTGYWEFNPLDASPAAGKLARYCDRNENCARCEYDATGRLIRVVDTLDRTNTISYNTAGQLASVTDFSGRTVTYAYYQGGETGGSPGDLKSVTSPPVIGTPNGNDFPAGKTTTYTYSTGYADDRKNHLLLSVIDAQGQTVRQFVYQYNETDFEFLRCVSLQRWTNTPAMLTYLPQTPTPGNQFAIMRCVMNDPVGNVTECFYDARNRCVMEREFTGRATPGMPVTDKANRPIGKLRASDLDYYEGRAEWNNDSLCKKLYLFGGQQVECVYESDFDKSTSARKRADVRVVREVACCDQDDDGDGLPDTLVTRCEYDPRFGSEPTAFNGPPRIFILLPSSGPMATARKGWDGTIKGRFAAGPRQSTSLNGTFASSAVQDFEKNTENVSGGFFPGNETGDGGGGFVTSMTDPRGNVSAASYDATGNRTETITYAKDPQNGKRQTVAFDVYGQETAITNAPDGTGYRRVDTFVYSQGQVVQCIVDAGAGGLRLTNKFDRDVRGNVTRYEDARGHDWLYTFNALDQCVREQTPVNLTARCATDFFYDENNNLFTVTGTVRDRFDNPVLDQVNRFRYDRLHRLTRVEWAVDASHSLTNDFVYDGNDQLVLVRGGDAVSGADPHQTVSFQPDERGLLFRESSAPGSADQSTTQYDYNANGNLTRLSEGLEGVPSTTTMEYDGFAGFGSDSPQMQSRMRVWQLMQGQNVQARLKESAHILIKRNCSASSQIQHRKTRKVATYDVQPCLARLSKITDAMGNVTTFHFDANDNLKLVRHFGQTNDVAGTNGNVRLAESRYEYDSLNRPIRVRNLFFDVSTQAPIGDGERTTTFTYAPNGQCTSVTDDLGRATTHTYDTVGWLASASSPSAKTTFAILRDRLGNITSCAQTDRSDLGGPPQVFSLTNVYDSLNRLVSSTNNVGNNENWDFDSLSRVVETTDPRGIHSFFEYDLLGRQTLAIRDLDGDGVPELSTDYSERATWSTSNGRLLATTDSNGNTTTNAYDSRGRRTSISNADGTRHQFTWSPRSNLVREEDPNGTVILHTYDLNDRCISNHYTPGPMVATSTTFEQYAYDGCSRLVSASNDGSDSTFAYDSLGRNTRDVSGGVGAMTTFDPIGNRLSLTYPGGRALTYAYDALNRCTNIYESGASLASFEYDGPDRVARISYGNGMRTRILYDGIAGTQNTPGDFGWGEVSAVNHAMAVGSPRIASVNLKWDRNGNKTTRADAIFAPAVPRTNNMALTYDNADRLVDSIVTSNGALVGFATYGLDLMGNRTNINRPFCAGNYSLDAFLPALDFQMNQYTATPCDARTYDENGNLTIVSNGPASSLNYTYDCHDRLVAVTDSGVPVGAYHYDALGRRIAKTVFDSGGLPPLTTTFLYDGDRVIEERESGSVTATFVLDASRSQDDGVIQMQRGGQTYYFHTDDQGNVLALTTTGGTVPERYDYDDYGAVTFLTSDGIPTSATSSIVGNPYCWNGLRLDAETGLHNNDGVDYREPQTARAVRGKVKDIRDSGGSGFAANNPWTGGGGSPNAMKSGTVKFFNEAKGFGMMGGNGGNPHYVPSGKIMEFGIDQTAGSGGGGGVFAIESRDTLKTHFETGGIPTQDQRMVPRNVLKSFFTPGAKPTSAQFGILIDSMVNIVDDRYLLGLHGSISIDRIRKIEISNASKINP